MENYLGVPPCSITYVKCERIDKNSNFETFIFGYYKRIVQKTIFQKISNYMELYELYYMGSKMYCYYFTTHYSCGTILLYKLIDYAK